MKKLVLSLSAFLSIIFTLSATTPKLKRYIENMCRACDYAAKVNYAVLLPQAEDPVEYFIDMQSTVVPADTLAPCRYLLSWKRGGADSDAIEGFTAYLDGAHYRYRDNRLQEYHVQWDSIPFMIKGGGVQCSAQFVDVLPQFVGRELGRLVNDTCFKYTFTPDTLYRGHNVSVLKGKLLYHGYTGKELTYIFNPATGMVSTIEYENNPGSISEQTVTISYSDPASVTFPLTCEDDLTALYPEIFEHFRESNFKVENLPGSPLPTFSAPTIAGERYTYQRGNALKKAAIIVVLDDSLTDPRLTLDAVTQAHETSPVDFTTIIAFVSNHPDKVEEIVDGYSFDNVIIGARALARDCGVTLYPTLLYVAPSGIVKDITLGYNKDLANIVIQKMLVGE